MVDHTEEKYKLLFNNLNDMVLLHKVPDRNGESELLEINDVTFTILGYSRQEMFGLSITEFCTLGQADVAALINRLTIDKNVLFETSLKTKSGKLIPVEVNSRLFDLHGQQVVLSILRDITERKLLEEKIKFISERDKLTGVYNRSYFEDMVARYHDRNQLPQGLLVCDVDGLKLINDTLGHHFGDRLIVSAARIIDQAVSPDGLIARIGGDEFVVLIDHKAKVTVDEVYARLKTSLEQYNQQHPLFPVRMSIGYSGRRSSLSAMLKAADDNMYKDKLQNKGKFADVAVEALRANLSEKDAHVEGHANRLQTMIAAFAASLGLTESDITNLRLLAKLHDIGKTAIPKHILNKKETLTADDWLEIRRHPEVGYRICKALPELIPVPDWVLKHHEHWDGNGYPFGLKEEEIPFESRILAILDAYDAMTNDRPYRQAMSRSQALAEIRKQAGKQFDPVLVEKFLELMAKSPDTGLMAKSPDTDSRKVG